MGEDWGGRDDKEALCGRKKKWAVKDSEKKKGGEMISMLYTTSSGTEKL